MTKITIDGKEITMKFNNASLEELRKLIFEDPYASHDIQDLLTELIKINDQNHYFVKKMLIYCGVVGYNLESNRIRPEYTFDEIGALVGKMTEEELIDYTLKAWNSFWDAMGVNLEKIKELEGQEEPSEKKK